MFAAHIGNESLVSTWSTVPESALVRPDGQIAYEGALFSTPSGAAIAARGGPANGWAMWAVTTPTGRVRLSTLRAKYLETK